MSLTVNVNIKRLALQLPPTSPQIDLNVPSAADLDGMLDITRARARKAEAAVINAIRNSARIDLFAKPRAIRIAGDGAHLQDEDTATPHVAVLYPDYGVMVHPHSLGDDDLTQQEAVKAARLLNVLGHKDWILACRTIWERLVLDTSRIGPAVDPVLYPGIKAGLHWTSTTLAQRDAAAGDPACAWGVYTSYGSVYLSPRNVRGFGLAARFVGQ